MWKFTLCMLSNLHSYCRLLLFFIFFSKNPFRNTIGVSISLDPDQARQYVGPDLGPKCLQWLSGDNTSNEGVKNHKIFSTCMWPHFNDQRLVYLQCKLEGDVKDSPMIPIFASWYVVMCLTSHQQLTSYGDGATAFSLIRETGETGNRTSDPWFTAPAKWSRTILECSKIILEFSRTMF